jgi:hypothetical protein
MYVIFVPRDDRFQAPGLLAKRGSGVGGEDEADWFSPEIGESDSLPSFAKDCEVEVRSHRA